MVNGARFFQGSKIWLYTFKLRLGSQVTGDVEVGVRTDRFQELGITLFKYIDDGENTLKQFIQDPALQARYFTMLAGNLANGIPTSGSHFAQALGPMNVLQNGKSRKPSPVSDCRVIWNSRNE